jgi:hypothetical protein
MSETMVFRRKAVEEATASLMAEHGVPHRGSEELIKIWESKPRSAR